MAAGEVLLLGLRPRRAICLAAKGGYDKMSDHLPQIETRWERPLFGLDAHSVLALTGWALFAGIFFMPFIQEDAAMIAAATASITGLAPTSLIFVTILGGLVASDAWKYWLGHAARRHAWAHKFAEKPGVSVAGDLVRNELVRTMYMARFVPGTRVPTYVACGFFQTPYLKFVGILVLTAFTYVCLWLAIFHTVGAVAGEQARFMLPAIALIYVAAYVAYRWIKHRQGRLGPLTPISPEFDHPLPEAPGFEGNPLEGHEAEAAEAGAASPERAKAPAESGS